VKATTDRESEAEESASAGGLTAAVRSPLELGIEVAEDPMFLRGDRACLGVPLERPMLLNGRWYVHGLLGIGGHAAVFCALDRQMRRQVALKVHLHTTPQQETYLLTEAEIAAKFQHPAIATILDIGIDSVSGRTFIVQELLQGATLREHLDRGSLPPLHTRLMWLVHLAEAIAYAHGCNVIHRDIKPENIFITTDGALKLMDFGIALTPALQDRARNEITPAYSPPEVLTLTPRSTPASDVFNWGLVAFELLSGGHHACGVSASMPKGAVLSRLQAVVVPTQLREFSPEVAPEVERVVMKTLRRKAVERPDAASLERRIKHIVLEDTESLSGALVKGWIKVGQAAGSPAVPIPSLPLWVHWRNLEKLASPRERLAYLLRVAIPALRIAFVVLLTVTFYTWSQAVFRERTDTESRAALPASTLDTRSSSARADSGDRPGGSVAGSKRAAGSGLLRLSRPAEVPGGISATIDGSTYSLGESLEVELAAMGRLGVTWKQVLPGYVEEETQTIELREGQELTLVPPFEAPTSLHVATRNPDEPGCLEVVSGKRRYVFSPLGSKIPVRPDRYRARFFPDYSCLGNSEMEVSIDARPGEVVRLVHHDDYLEVDASLAAKTDKVSVAAISR
jgi:serine/threonine protein kinase